MNHQITRRFFIGGTAAFSAAAVSGGWKGMLAATAPTGAPNLRLGVISDVHISRLANSPSEEIAANVEITLERTLRYFRDQRVDGVVIAGDLSDWGHDEGLAAVATAWYRVFPDDRAPDGSPVEKIFIYGNHECYSSLGEYTKKLFPTEELRKQHVLRLDMGGFWKKYFHEDYSRLYEKEIKGYRFLGCHWDCWSAKGDCHSLIVEYLKKNGGQLDPKRPFFYVQHPSLKNTCNGPWAWNHDYGVATAALTPYPNAIAISGHTHYSLTDERSFWQEAFTSINAGSLSYTGLASDSNPPAGYENGGSPDKDAARIDAAKMLPNAGGNLRDCRQGMVWEVFDDVMVIRRREFVSGMSLGPDIVMPLAIPAAKPFAFANRAKSFRAPEFAADAVLTVERVKAKNRGKKEFDAVKLTVPPVKPDAKARAFEMDFTAEGSDGVKKTKRVAVKGFNHALGHKRTLPPTVCVFSQEELPAGPVKFSAIPRNCFGTCGHPLVHAEV